MVMVGRRMQNASSRGLSHVFRLLVLTALNDANNSGMPLCFRDSKNGDDDGDDGDDGNIGAGEEREAFAVLAAAVAIDLHRHGVSPLSVWGRVGGGGGGAANAV